MNARNITNDIAISGQPSRDELGRVAEQGYRTVVNLRTADEPGVLSDEERLVEGAGLTYAAIPVSPGMLDDAAVERFSQALASVDGTPALVHCKGGGRAGMMTLLHLAIQNGWSLEQTLDEGKKLGDIAPPESSPYRAFFESFIKRHSPAHRQEI